MRNAVLGALVIASLWMLVAGVAGGRDRLAAAGPVASEGAGQELVTLATPVGDNRQMLTIVDPRTRAICVYHVELATGAIALKSVRHIHWDLQMTEYNTLAPLPREIQHTFGQR